MEYDIIVKWKNFQLYYIIIFGIAVSVPIHSYPRLLSTVCNMQAKNGSQRLRSYQVYR
nr:hypothetical protein [Escherichia coli]